MCRRKNHQSAVRLAVRTNSSFSLLPTRRRRAQTAGSPLVHMFDYRLTAARSLYRHLTHTHGPVVQRVQPPDRSKRRLLTLQETFPGLTLTTAKINPPSRCANTCRSAETCWVKSLWKSSLRNQAGLSLGALHLFEFVHVWFGSDVILGEASQLGRYSFV